MASLVTYVESLGVSTTTSSAYQNKLSATPTLVNGTTYVIIWSAQVNYSATNALNFRIRDHTGSTTLKTGRLSAKDSTDYLLVGGTVHYTATADAAREFRIEYNEEASGTSSIKNARMLILALDSDDFHTASTGSTNTTSSTFSDKLSLDVTGAEAEPYLFIGNVSQATISSDGNAEFRGLQTDGSTEVNKCAGLWALSGTTQNYSVMWVETLTGGSATAKIQHRSVNNSSTVTSSEGYLAAIKISSLGAYEYTLETTPSAGTDTVSTDVETLVVEGTDTTAGDVLVFADVTYLGDDSTVSSLVNFVEGSTAIADSITEDRGAAANGTIVTALFAYKSATANTTETFKWRRLSETSAATTTVNRAGILVVGLTVDTEQDLTPTGYTNTNAFGTPKVGHGLKPTAFTNTNAFGTPAISFRLQPTSIVNAATFGTAVITSTVGLTATGFANTNTFGTPVVNFLTTLTPAGFANTNTYGTPLLTLYVAPSSYTNTNNFGSATVANGILLEPTGFANTNTFGTPALTFVILPTGFANTNNIGSPVVFSGELLEPPSITSTNAFGTPELDFKLYATGLTNANTFGTPSLIPYIAPPSIENTNAFGTPRFTLYLSTTSITHTNSFGSPGLQFDLQPPSIVSVNSFGTAVVSTDNTLTAVGYANTNTFGTPRLAVPLRPTGLTNTSVFGTPRVANTKFLLATGYANTNTFGSHTLIADKLLVTTGITNINTFGVALVGRESSFVPVRRPGYYHMRMRS